MEERRRERINEINEAMKTEMSGKIGKSPTTVDLIHFTENKNIRTRYTDVHVFFPHIVRTLST